jgi:PilZ domain-containing protein
VKEFRTRLGQVVLLERVGDGETTPLTGVVLESATAEIVTIDLMAPPAPDLDGVEVTVSVFAPEAMYRARATLRLRGDGHRAELGDLDPEDPVQRRRWPRRTMSLPVSVVTVDEETPAGVVGETIDLSLGGARIVTHEPLPATGDPLVALTLPDGGVLLMQGRVVHSAKTSDAFTYGLVFPDIEGDDAARLSEVLAFASSGTS